METFSPVFPKERVGTVESFFASEACTEEVIAAAIVPAPRVATFLKKARLECPFPSLDVIVDPDVAGF
jgi:hypothetical protein